MDPKDIKIKPRSDQDIIYQFLKIKDGSVYDNFSALIHRFLNLYKSRYGNNLEGVIRMKEVHQSNPRTLAFLKIFSLQSIYFLNVPCHSM